VHGLPFGVLKPVEDTQNATFWTNTWRIGGKTHQTTCQDHQQLDRLKLYTKHVFFYTGDCASILQHVIGLNCVTCYVLIFNCQAVCMGTTDGHQLSDPWRRRSTISKANFMKLRSIFCKRQPRTFPARQRLSLRASPPWLWRHVFVGLRGSSIAVCFDQCQMSISVSQGRLIRLPGWTYLVISRLSLGSQIQTNYGRADPAVK